MREVMPPGTKIPKDQQDTMCECETTANEFSPCCYGCAFGEAIVCLSQTRAGNVCAGESSTETPDPRCSLEDSYLTAQVSAIHIVGEPLTTTGVTFYWEWYNQHTTALPKSAALMETGAIQDQLRLEAWRDPDEVGVDVDWEQSIPSCEYEEEQQTLQLAEEGYWNYTIVNLPGGAPRSTVSVSEPFGG